MVFLMFFLLANIRKVMELVKLNCFSYQRDWIFCFPILQCKIVEDYLFGRRTVGLSQPGARGGVQITHHINYVPPPSDF